MEEQKQKAYWIGIVVLVLLAVITAGEFLVGLVAAAWWAPLLSIAALKAFFVLRDYMHIGRVFSNAEAESEEH
jgi:hypothetical protein